MAKLHENLYVDLENLELDLVDFDTARKFVADNCNSFVTDWEKEVKFFNQLSYDSAAEVLDVEFSKDDESLVLEIGLTEAESEADLYPLLETAAVMRIIMKQLLQNNKYKNWNSFGDNTEGETVASALDLLRPKDVAIDNIQTVLDVFRVALQKKTDQLSILSTMKQLVTRGTEQGKESQLEQCARAPFGFWAYTRRMLPQEIDGRSVLTELGFSEEFLDLVRVGKVMDMESEREKRHGGCPVLYREYRNLDLINKLGIFFIKLHSKLHSQVRK